MYQHIVSSKRFDGEWMEVPGGRAGTYGRPVPNPVLGQGSVSTCGVLKMGCYSIMKALCCTGL